MPVKILMPALSPTMETGNLAKWLKKEGDPVRAGDIVAEIETDKATMEYEAVDEGTLAKILVPEGASDIPVNEPIAILLSEGEDESAIEEAQRQPTPKPTPDPSQKPTDMLLATDPIGPADSDPGSGGQMIWAIWVLLSALLIVGSGWVIRRQRFAEARDR